MSTASDGPQIEPSWSAQVCPGYFGSEIMHITHFMSIMQFIAIMQVYINTSKNTGGSVSSHSLISTSCCLNVVVSSCKLHSLLHSDRTIWRMWNYHRSRDSRASTLVFEGWRASILVIEVLWWSSIIVEMLNRRFFVVRIDIIWKRGLIMHKLCTLCNLCKLLHSYVIYAFYVTDCIIMQIMNIPCIFCIVDKIKLIITAMYITRLNRVGSGNQPGFRRVTNPALDAYNIHNWCYYAKNTGYVHNLHNSVIDRIWYRLHGIRLPVPFAA